jgi:PHD/YefM family antitoxin component YafN of YafNO toxin-antitoxin module
LKAHGACISDLTYIAEVDTLSSTRATQDLDRLMDGVSDHGAPLIVKRLGKRPVVVMDLEEYRGTGTLYRVSGKAADQQREIARCRCHYRR